jgi:hypothetical protein
MSKSDSDQPVDQYYAPHKPAHWRPVSCPSMKPKLDPESQSPKPRNCKTMSRTSSLTLLSSRYTMELERYRIHFIRPSSSARPDPGRGVMLSRHVQLYPSTSKWGKACSERCLHRQVEVRLMQAWKSLSLLGTCLLLGGYLLTVLSCNKAFGGCVVGY